MKFLKTHEGFQTAASLNLQGTLQSILIQLFEAIAHNVVVSENKKCFKGQLIMLQECAITNTIILFKIDMEIT